MQSSQIIWDLQKLQHIASAPVMQILTQAGLGEEPEFPTIERINRCFDAFSLGKWSAPRAKGQSTFADDESRYYETLIAEEKVVPTREQNWHDLFNALIWMQFPRTKSILNQLHIEDIQKVGAKPRTPRRDRITHFDECGVVLAVPQYRLGKGQEVLNALDEHHWSLAFGEFRARWFTDIYPVVFGHANLEMMLSPFIGLTGKWMAVVVPNHFEQVDWQTQCNLLDEALGKRIIEYRAFDRKNWLKPLPLLGVPHWYQNQSESFYSNTDYFRKKRPQTPKSEQLPLT